MQNQKQSPQAIHLEPQNTANASIIWLHGLGASADDFIQLPQMLQLPSELQVRYVLAQAPNRPVTINGGMLMPAWYDIISLDGPRDHDLAGMQETAAAIDALIQEQNDAGIPTERIILGGFSQGAAMSLFTGLRYSKTLAGIIALSGYLPFTENLADALNTAQQKTPVFIGHGEFDDVVPVWLGKETATAIKKQELAVTEKYYPMTHEVSLEELADASDAVTKMLGE